MNCSGISGRGKRSERCADKKVAFFDIFPYYINIVVVNGRSPETNILS